MASPDLAATLGARVADLVAQARAAERLVATGHPEGVHDLRVSFRRLRSLLRSFDRALGWDDAPAVRDELARAGGALSGLRDLEVVQERIALDPDAAEVAAHVATALAAELGRHDARRFDQVLSVLDGLPVREVAGRGDAGRVLGRERRRLDRALGAAALDDEVALHEARKVAKRSRYAAETLVPLLGADAQRVADRARAVQEALGDHRDTLLVRGVVARLRHVLDDPAAADRLAAREAVVGEAALARYDDLRNGRSAPVD